MTFGLYLLLNIVILLFFALWIRRLVIRRLAPDRILSDLSDEIGALISELNRTGDHNISILEDRIRDLRELLAAADRQIDDLSSTIALAREAADRAPGVDHARGGDSYAPGPLPATDEYTQSAPDHADPVYRVDFGHRGSEGGGAAPPGAAERLVPGQSSGWGLESAYASELPSDIAEPILDPALTPSEQVRELHLQGVSPDLIASRTGMAIGEIELIISLGSRKGRR